MENRKAKLIVLFPRKSKTNSNHSQWTINTRICLAFIPKFDISTRTVHQIRPSQARHRIYKSAHYNDVIMGAMASQITSLTIVYSTVYSGRSKKTPKLRVTGLCAGNSLVTGEFPAQMVSNSENVSIWWLHHWPTTTGYVKCIAQVKGK